ncbi:MAG: type II secretion system protein J [Planctomycetota bacterium]
MRYSARSTDRRAGVTLLEVIIGVSIFSVVLIVALSQMNESGDAVRLATLQADLRKNGERVLAAIVKDVRSTQTCYSGAATNGSALEMAKVSGFDTTNKLNILEGNVAGTSANVVGNSTVLYKYSQPSTDNSTFGGDKNLGCLVFEKGVKTAVAAGTAPLTTKLCQELAKFGDTDWPYGGTVNGFEVSRVDGVALPGLLTGNLAFTTYNTQAAPVTLRIKLILKRAVGFTQTGVSVKKQFVWTTLDTQVQLRTDESY